MKRPILSVFLLSIWVATFDDPSCLADVKSTNLPINFDVNRDGINEMGLSGNGLFIGTPVVEAAANLHVLGNAIVTHQLSIGGSGGSSNLNIYGTLANGIQTVSSNTRLSDYGIVLVNSASSNVNIIMPYAGNIAGRIYSLKKSSTTNNVWIYGDNCTIEDVSSIEWLSGNTLPSLELISNGQQWLILKSYGTVKTVASDNLIGWWKLDETSGTTVKDSSTGGRNGTYNNGTITGNSGPGVVNNAIKFNNSEYINIGNTLDLDETSFSICFWAKRENPGVDSDYIIGQGIGGQSIALHIGFQNSNNLNFGFYSNDKASSSGYAQTDWNFWVVTHDVNTKFKNIFRNNTEIPAGAWGATESLNSSGNNFHIGGSYGSGADPFRGYLDDVRIYNKVLTTAEISAIYGDYKKN